MKSFDTANLYRDTATDLRGLSEMRRRARAADGTDPATLRRVAGQFEALFVQTLLKEARATDFGEGLFSSNATKTYQGMLDQQVALEVGESGSLGFARLLVRQLGGDDAQAPTSREVPLSVPVPAHHAGGARVGAAAWREPADAAEFVGQVLPQARQAAAELGVPVAAVLAQAALESGWGRGMPARADGRPSLNLFGIKADGRWDGAVARAETLEFRGGALQRERAGFRAYDSLGQAFADYAAFLRGSPRYRQALASGDAEGFLRGLAEAGYATDPAYGDKLVGVLHGAPLREALATAGVEGADPDAAAAGERLVSLRQGPSWD